MLRLREISAPASCSPAFDLRAFPQQKNVSLGVFLSWITSPLCLDHSGRVDDSSICDLVRLQFQNIGFSVLIYWKCLQEIRICGHLNPEPLPSCGFCPTRQTSFDLETHFLIESNYIYYFFSFLTAVSLVRS